jgi:sialate O-acetylesterase
MNPTRLFALFAAALLSFSNIATADVKLPPVLSDHMVLQREKTIPIWGTAAAGEEVTVKFRDQAPTAKADKDGKWKVELKGLKAGGPDELTIKGKNEIVYKDILVGEVWVGSGQSNMQGSVKGYAANDPVLAKLGEGTYPKIRISMNGGTWKEANPANLAGFSAILFAFGAALEKDLDVPVGLMAGSVGGTPSGFWLSEEAFKADSEVQQTIKTQLASYDPVKAKAQLEKDLVKWEEQAAAAKAADKNPPAKPQLNVPGEPRGKIGNLYEKFIRPMQPYGIRGVLWDQGESGTAVNNVDQFTLMGALIKGWRKEWNQGEFPFIYVQKMSGGGCAWDPKDPITDKSEPFAALPKDVPGDGAYRLHHIGIMKHPATYMAIASDLGSGIHPSNKSGYGYRAARVALGAVYDRKVEYYGPTYKSHSVEGDKVRVSFEHVGQGLASKHGDKLQGFAVAGEDGKFVWADATIDGNAVVLSNPAVKAPKSVSYAASAKHNWANLFNKDGLPAIPFTTASKGK